MERVGGFGGGKSNVSNVCGQSWSQHLQHQAVATSLACTTLVLNSVSLLYQCCILQQSRKVKHVKNRKGDSGLL